MTHAPDVIDKVARAIALAQYTLALKLSADPKLRKVAERPIPPAIFESAWKEDTGNVRTLGMFAAPFILAAMPLRTPDEGVMKIVTDIADRQHEKASGRHPRDGNEAHAHVATLIDLWNRFVCRIPGLDEYSLRPAEGE